MFPAPDITPEAGNFLFTLIQYYYYEENNFIGGLGLLLLIRLRIRHGKGGITIF